MDGDSRVKTEFVWSALDCPDFFAFHERLGPDNMFLLGQLAVEIIRPVSGNQPLIVYAWKKRVDGRKFFSGSAISTAAGELLAHSDQVWIKLKG